MNYRKKFLVAPGDSVRLTRIDPSYSGKHKTREEALAETQRQLLRMDRLQRLLWADATQSLLIVLQAVDAGGKDGVIRHLFTGMNPQGTSVFGFKQPNKVEAAHDFLWRAHLHAPGKGEIAIFNRSHYEDVLVVRVHRLVPKADWSRRYERINEFEKLLSQCGTKILKFFLHISPEEQLARFKQRLDDPARRWKISESDYAEREQWDRYASAFEDAIERTSTEHAPWYIVPADQKWFRDLAISQIIADAMEDMDLKTPPPQMELADIRRRYLAAEKEQEKRRRKSSRRG